MEKTSSQDQCASSDSVRDECYEKHGQDMKAAFFLHNPDFSMNASHAEISQPIVQFPYAYADPYFTGLYTAYGPHNMIQPQVMAAASGRIPLPADIPEEGPIYVNAKQYHGILRRRQTRAKLEAQNKLLKNRKPYLHESRHQHALNRVRGSGGRFLRKAQQSDSPHPTGSTAENLCIFSKKTDNYESAPSATESTRNSTAGDASLQQQDGRYSNSISSHNIQSNGGLVYNGNRHYAMLRLSGD